MSDGTTPATGFPASDTGFPNAIIAAIKKRLEFFYPDIPAFARPIRIADPVAAWGLVAGEWTPNSETWEFIGDRPLSAPTVGEYTIAIQSYNQHMDPTEGLKIASSMAGFVRTMLSRDPDTRVALAALTSSEFGFTESVRRFQVSGQRFVSNEIDGSFLFLTNLEFVIETETR